MGGVVEADVLAGQPRDHHHASLRDGAVEKERLAALTHRQVRRFTGRLGERVHVIVAHRDQPAPAALVRQAPRRGAQHERVGAVGIGEEAAPAERVRQAERVAPIDAQQRRQLLQRYGLRRLADGLEDRQPPIETLHSGSATDGSSAHEGIGQERLAAA